MTRIDYYQLHSDEGALNMLLSECCDNVGEYFFSWLQHRQGSLSQARFEAKSFDM